MRVNTASRVVAPVAALLLLVAAAGAQNLQPCPGLQSCQTSTVNNGVVTYYDLNGLCNGQGGYSVMDSTNHTYNFNICGSTSTTCNPSGYRVYQDTGAGIQSWGSTPICSETTKNCVNPYTDQAECCTADCFVLGLADEPQIQFVTNGVVVAHKQMIAIKGDPFGCPPDPVTGFEAGRQLFYDITCNPQQYDLLITGVDTTNACEYHILMEHRLACGCVPQCDGKGCGYDGCYGQCGSCFGGAVCTVDDVCCIPDCVNSNCGSDGCGGSCGACPEFYACSDAGICVLNEQQPSHAGSIAGAYFGGVATVLVLAAVGFFVKRQRSKGRAKAGRLAGAGVGDTYGSL